MKVFEFELWRGDALLATAASGDRKQAYDEIAHRQRPYVGDGLVLVYEVCRHPVPVLNDTDTPCTTSESTPPESTVDLEQYRREPATLDAVPVKNLSFDYGHAGTLIDRAVHHLDEGLPNGQHLRCKHAFAVLKRGVYELEQWMSAKGYFKDIRNN